MRLFEPLEVRGHKLRNRVVFTSHAGWPFAYTPGDDGRDYEEYLRRRAAGGSAVVMLMCTDIAAWGDPRAMDFLRERFTRISDAIRGEGAISIIQLQAMGFAAFSIYQPDGIPISALSPVPHGDETPHEWTDAEILEFIERYGTASELAVQCGIDGVELHGGHGYLLHQSMAPWGNFRTDRWRREDLLFWNLVIERVRRAIGPDRILGTRFSGDDHRSPEEGGLSTEQLAEIASRLTDLGEIDYFNITEGSNDGHYGRVVGTYHRPHGDFLASAARIREGIGRRVPVIGVSRITTPEEAEAALERGDCDLVALTRAQIADPDFVKKARSGAGARIRPCVGANQGCIDRSAKGMTITCFHHPEAGNERRIDWQKARAPKRITIVGAGPAGLKAGEIAARRGHQVIILERSNRIGGRLAAISDVTSASELRLSVDWLEGEMDALPVEIRLNVEADAAAVAATRPDHVIVATGSYLPEASWKSDGSVSLLAPEEALAREADNAGLDLLVWDELGNEEAEVVVEQLAAQGARVTVATPFPNVGAYLGYTHACDYFPRLIEAGCRVEERQLVVDVVNGEVATQTMGRPEIVRRRFDHVVRVVPRQPNAALAAALAGTCDVKVIGDALSVRNAFSAFREGYWTGLRI